MFPDGYFAREFYLDLEAPRSPTCGLSIRAGAREFDPEGSIDLAELVAATSSRAEACRAASATAAAAFSSP